MMSGMRGLAVVSFALVSVLLTSGCAASSIGGEQPRPTSQQDAILLAKNCMSDQGWEVEIIDGATAAEVPDSQMDSYLRAVSECSNILGFTTPRELTDEELKLAFEAQVANRSCLMELGYELPEGPTLQAYIDAKGAWTPFSDLPDLDPDEFASVERECPQYQVW